MSRYFPKDTLSWKQEVFPVGTMESCHIWEGGNLGIVSGFYRMPRGMAIPMHKHFNWTQVMVLEGEMVVESQQAGGVRIAAGGCYFVEPGDIHAETAVEDTLILVTSGEYGSNILDSVSLL